MRIFLCFCRLCLLTCNDLNTKESEIATATTPRVEPSNMFGQTEGRLKTTGSGEEPGGEETPHASPKMDGNGINSVVDLELEKKGGGEEVHPSSDDTNDKGSPGLDGSARGRNCNQTSKTTIHGGCEIVGDKSSSALINYSVSKQSREGTGSGPDRGVDGGERSNIA